MRQVGLILFQFKLPKGDLERLLHADSEEQHRQVIETFAASLPITNRTVTGGKTHICSNLVKFYVGFEARLHELDNIYFSDYF